MNTATGQIETQHSKLPLPKQPHSEASQKSPRQCYYALPRSDGGVRFGSKAQRLIFLCTSLHHDNDDIVEECSCPNNCKSFRQR